MNDALSPPSRLRWSHDCDRWHKRTRGRQLLVHNRQPNTACACCSHHTPPTDREILKNRNRPRQKFFGKKQNVNTRLDKAQIGGNNWFYSKAWGWVDGTHRIISNRDRASRIECCFSRRQFPSLILAPIQKTQGRTRVENQLKSIPLPWLFCYPANS